MHCLLPQQLLAADPYTRDLQSATIGAQDVDLKGQRCLRRDSGHGSQLAEEEPEAPLLLVELTACLN